MMKKTIASTTYRNSSWRMIKLEGNTFWIRTRCIDCSSVPFASYFKVMKLLLIRSQKHAREEFKYLSHPNIPNCRGSEIIENNEKMSHITWKVDYSYLLLIFLREVIYLYCSQTGLEKKYDIVWALFL